MRNIFLYSVMLVGGCAIGVVMSAPCVLIPSQCGLLVPIRLKAAPALGAEPECNSAAQYLFEHAVRIGNEEVVRLLLQHGPALGKLRSLQEEPLISAAIDSGAELSMLRLLLEAGADAPRAGGLPTIR